MQNTHARSNHALQVIVWLSMATRRSINRHLLSTLAGMLVVAVMVPTLANAQACTLTAGGATYSIPATSHYDASQTSNFTGVGTGDYLFEDGWWFRVSGETLRSTFSPFPRRRHVPVPTERSPGRT